MSDPERHRLALRKLRNQYRHGDAMAANNIAATYRELGRFRRAFRWWRRAAGPQNGDAWLEVGYCLQYGIGTRRDHTAAIRAYRQVMRTPATTECGCDEAQYHLAIALLDRADTRYREEIERLLRRAAEDGDYPDAADLLRQVGKGQPLLICRCRRGFTRRFGGKTHCTLHNRPVARQIKGRRAEGG